MNDLTHTLHRLLYPIACDDRGEQLCYLIVALHQDILMIEPYSLLEIELRTGLRTLGDIKLLYQLIQRKDLLLCARVPS